MIITSILLSDIAFCNASNDSLPTDPMPKASILLACHLIKGIPKLILCDWLATDMHWQDKVNLAALANHYKFNIIDTQFIPASELSASNSEQQLLLASIAQLQQYLQGLRHTFELPLDTTLGTPFQQKVWQALLDIKHGDTISYATLAQRVNNPKGFRAVANANGKNPLSIFIPCHRVIGSDGKLGGYTGGVDKKAYLLALEGVRCRS